MTNMQRRNKRKSRRGKKNKNLKIENNYFLLLKVLHGSIKSHYFKIKLLLNESILKHLNLCLKK